MRVGIFGGTFDPIHFGHLVHAEQSREQADLDRVWLVPAPRPPHKLDQSMTPFRQRVEMAELALAGHDDISVVTIEEEREGPSYTVDTLEELHQRHPDDEFFLLVGSDTLSELHTWYRPQRLLELAGLLVMARPGSLLLSEKQLREQLGLDGEARLDLRVVETPLMEIASTDLRRRVGEGRSIRYFLPRSVECYIEEKGLYRE